MSPRWSATSLVVLCILLAVSASAGNTSSIGDVISFRQYPQQLKQAWDGLDHPLIAAGKKSAQTPSIFPQFIHLRQWDALELAYFNLRATHLAITAAMPMAYKASAALSSWSKLHGAAAMLGVNSSSTVYVRSPHEALQHMASDVQQLCHLLDQPIHRLSTSAPAQLTIQLMQKLSHATMQHFVRPAAQTARILLVQPFFSHLSSANSHLKSSTTLGVVRSFVVWALSGVAPDSSNSRSRQWTDATTSATDYLTGAWGYVDSFLEGETIILVLFLWIILLMAIVTAGVFAKMKRMESAMLAMHKSGAAKHLTHSKALESNAATILNLQQAHTRTQFSHRLLKKRFTTTARQQRRVKAQLANLKRAQATAERQATALQRRSERQEAALQTKVNRLEAVLSETLGLQSRLQGVVSASDSQFKQLQLEIAALKIQRDSALAAQMSKQEKLEQQLVEQAVVIDDLRSRLEDGKLAQKELETRLAGFSLAKVAEAETESMSSVPLTDISLIKASRGWYGTGTVDGNGSSAGDQEDAPAQTPSTAAEAAAGMEGPMAAGDAGVGVMPSMAVTLAQQASDEGGHWYGTGPIDHNGSEVGDEDIPQEGFATFPPHDATSPASDEMQVDTTPAGRAVGIKGTGIHQGAFSLGPQDFAGQSKASFGAFNESPAQVYAEQWDIEPMAGDFMGEPLLGAAQESSAAVPTPQQELPLSKWGTVKGSIKRRLSRLTSGGYRKTL